MNDHRQPPTEDRDDVATLLRLAGKRPAVPPERAERVRAAAHAQWSREVRRRSRRRYLYGAAGLAAAASLILAITLWVLPYPTGGPTGSDQAIRVEVLTGPAWSRVLADRPNAAPTELRIGGEVPVGSELVTAGDGRAAIRLASGHSVRLDTATKIRLLEGGSFALDQGAIYIDSGSDAAVPGSFEVQTPLGPIQEIGTQFEVRLQDGAVRLRLREGAVVMRHHLMADTVQAGAELLVNPDGSATRRAIPTHGPEWAWIAGITPMPDLEGLTARAFLDWIARERGLRLAFADEAVARAAGETVLGGTVKGLTPGEALDAVLPTCRMTHQVEEGVLLVAAATEGQP